MSTEENKVLEAKISKKITKPVLIGLIIYAVVALVIIITGFAVGCYYSESEFYSIVEHGYIDSKVESPGWYTLDFYWHHYFSDGDKIIYDYPENVVAVVFIILIMVLIPVVYLLISYRRRKLTSLMVTETEIIGSYTAFIPISKITLRMPIEKIDNVSAVKNFLFLFKGKAIIIRSTSGKVRIYYVENADEVVAFILEAIQNARQSKSNNAAPTPDNGQNDYIESIKKLSELRNAGILTEEEFNKKKNELLNKM